MNQLQRLILAALLAMPGPQTVADIAALLGVTEAEVSPEVDELMNDGSVAPDGAGIDITPAGEAIVIDSQLSATVPADESPAINLAFLGATTGGDTFLDGERALGLTGNDVRAFAATYLELASRAAIKAASPILLQRAAARVALLNRLAAVI